MKKLHPKTLTFQQTKSKLHINVFSRSGTVLGRLLSNFAHTPFILDGKRYESVEGYWYSKVTGEDLSKTFGHFAKQAGKLFPRKFEEPSKEELKTVYLLKLEKNPHIKELLLKNDRPFAHYYVMMGKMVNADKYLWIADLWREITDELKSK